VLVITINKFDLCCNYVRVCESSARGSHQENFGRGTRRVARPKSAPMGCGGSKPTGAGSPEPSKDVKKATQNGAVATPTEKERSPERSKSVVYQSRELQVSGERTRGPGEASGAAGGGAGATSYEMIGARQGGGGGV
jgi:hypothetical protein